MQPNSSLAVQVTFHPRVEAASNYNVACLVKRKPSRLMLNVKGEGYAVHNSLQMETADGQLVHLSPDVPNSIDFGQVRGVLCSVSGCRLRLPLASPLPTCGILLCCLGQACDLRLWPLWVAMCPEGCDLGCLLHTVHRLMLLGRTSGQLGSS